MESGYFWLEDTCFRWLCILDCFGGWFLFDWLKSLECFLLLLKAYTFRRYSYIVYCKYNDYNIQ